jgi:hypothetical protein
MTAWSRVAAQPPNQVMANKALAAFTCFQVKKISKQELYSKIQIKLGKASDLVF